MASQGHNGHLCTVVTPNDNMENMENLDNMTIEELRDALRNQKARVDAERKRADAERKRADAAEKRVLALEDALKTEKARYVFGLERLWLTRSFRTCSTQHSFVIGHVM